MAHVGKEAALEFGDLAQWRRLVVELGVQRDHAPVRFVELGAQRGDVRVTRGQLAIQIAGHLRNHHDGRVVILAGVIAIDTRPR